jgi:hypothetical protein
MSVSASITAKTDLKRAGRKAADAAGRTAT